MGNYEHPFGNDENHEKRLKIFRAMFRKCEVLLLPIYPLGPEHFTLIVVRKVEGGHVEVRYF